MMEKTNNMYVVSMNKNVAARVINTNGKYLTFLGEKSNIRYFMVPSYDHLFDLFSKLDERERLVAEPVTIERLSGFLPKEFLSKLETMVRELN